MPKYYHPGCFSACSSIFLKEKLGVTAIAMFLIKCVLFLTRCAVHVGMSVPAEVDYFLKSCS